MKCHQDSGIITYEWLVQPFDRFPERPTALYRGKRLGLDVAVVAKNSNKNESSRLPTFLTWGSPPLNFKGIDDASLGELILIGRPEP